MNGTLVVGFAHLDAARGTAVTHQHIIQSFTWRKCQMGNYTLEEVIKRWTRGDMTTEQVVGQTLLIIQDIARRVGTLEKLREAERNGGKEEKGQLGE